MSDRTMNGNNCRINSEMTIGELLKTYPVMQELFRSQYFGYVFPGDFNCTECPLADHETLREAAHAHGIDPDEFIQMLNNEMERVGG